MNAPSRSPNAIAAARRPQRPLSTMPADQETRKEFHSPSYLVQEDANKPFQLLETQPLSLLCRFHNVKRVSLEQGVPPPFQFDVPLLRSALESPNALLPTHILAVYDQDSAPGPAPSSSLFPYTTAVPSGPSSLPSTPLMIPVNADLWAHHFSSTLSSNHVPVPLPSPPPPIPAFDAMRRHSRTSSVASSSSYTTNNPSPSRSRPRAILSLPVHVMTVPSAKSLPLLLLASLGVLPSNSMAPALLPRAVLVEFPSCPAILTQHLLNWLYPTINHWQRRVRDDSCGRSNNRDIIITAEIQERPSSRRPRPPSSQPPLSPLLSPASSTSASESRRFSSTSASSSTSISSNLSPASPLFSPLLSPPEPICALTDPATADDPDMRLLALVQQNFGLWANALALGVKDTSVVQLVELAWSVSVDARRLRFGDPTEGDRRSQRSRSRTPL
ncbi:hypothetical protein DFH11DRAFT_1511938 [Phellopilus nigrolimitatus]|nr:hypothetical protein DFH11DRAFT_1511938 [Phellopilus nigrolimitatus]